MYNRNVIFVDDNPKLSTIIVPEYKDQIDELLIQRGLIDSYTINIISFGSIEEAKDHLSKGGVVDVLVIDYNFNGASVSGIDLIRHIRDEVNKFCKIIFYTMTGINLISKSDIADLVNNNVYRLIDKTTDMLPEAILSAAFDCNPIITSLEYFYQRYNKILKNYMFIANDKKINFEELMIHVRMNDDIGRNFIDKTIYKSIIDSIDF